MNNGKRRIEWAFRGEHDGARLKLLTPDDITDAELAERLQTWAEERGYELIGEPTFGYESVSH